jgi:hypothetical protein
MVKQLPHFVSAGFGIASIASGAMIGFQDSIYRGTCWIVP